MLSVGRVTKCVVAWAAAAAVAVLCSNMELLQHGRRRSADVVAAAAEALISTLNTSAEAPGLHGTEAPGLHGTKDSPMEAYAATSSLEAPTPAPKVATTGAVTSPGALDLGSSTSRMPTTRAAPPAPVDLSGPRSETIAIMLAMQRSGTNFLAVELSRHPCIDFQHELFNDLKLKIKPWPWTPKLRQKVVRRFLDLHFDAADIEAFPENTQSILNHSLHSFKAGIPVRGFNWKLNQDFLPSWQSWLPDVMIRHHIRLIWVQRQNLLRRIFSNQANKKTHLFGTMNESLAKAVGSVKVALDPSTILDELKNEEEKVKKARKVLREAKQKGLKVLTVFYENITDSLETMRSFLLEKTSCSRPADAPLEEVSGYSKIHTKSLQDSVQNWDQLRQKLRHTKWEWMLYGS